MKEFQYDSLHHIFTQIESLPDPYRRAVIFVMKHHDLLMQMCREEKISEKRRQELIDDAIRRKDMIRLAIILFERAVNEQ